MTHTITVTDDEGRTRSIAFRGPEEGYRLNRWQSLRWCRLLASLTGGHGQYVSGSARIEGNGPLDEERPWTLVPGEGA